MSDSVKDGCDCGIPPYYFYNLGDFCIVLGVRMWPQDFQVCRLWQEACFQEYLWILTLKNILTNHIDISIMPYVSPSCKIKIWLTSSPLGLYSNDSYTYNIQKNYSFIDLVFHFYSLEISINLMILGFSI